MVLSTSTGARVPRWTEVARELAAQGVKSEVFWLGLEPLAKGVRRVGAY